MLVTRMGGARAGGDQGEGQGIVIGAFLADKKGRSRNTHKHMNIHSLVQRRTGEHMGCCVCVCACVGMCVCVCVCVCAAAAVFVWAGDSEVEL